MKTKILTMMLIVAVAATGCLKRDTQPVNNLSVIKAHLVGSWKGTTSIIAYYDAAGSEAGSSTVAPVNVHFDSQGNMTETTTGANPTTLTGKWSVISDASGSVYLVTSGEVGNHNYAIPSATSDNITLYESMHVTEGATTTINGKSITYYSTIQVSTFNKTSSI